jgi:hypothetical protein
MIAADAMHAIALLIKSTYLFLTGQARTRELLSTSVLATHPMLHYNAMIYNDIYIYIYTCERETPSSIDRNRRYCPTLGSHCPGNNCIGVLKAPHWSGPPARLLQARAVRPGSRQDHVHIIDGNAIAMARTHPIAMRPPLYCRKHVNVMSSVCLSRKHSVCVSICLIWLAAS